MVFQEEETIFIAQHGIEATIYSFFRIIEAETLFISID
jgi:hypothetical protein